MSVVAVLQDMESFCQYVGHHSLELPALHEFLTPLLRLALHLYTGPKHLMLARAPVCPSRSVVPVCTWAGTLIKVYYLAPFDAFVAGPKVELDVFVDDIQVAAQGNGAAVVDKFTEATLDFSKVVETEIQSRLVPAKAALVALQQS